MALEENLMEEKKKKEKRTKVKGKMRISVGLTRT
jgi:hypothetical protein